jgi:hypothetical protein
MGGILLHLRPPARELQRAEWEVLLHRRESRADPGDAAKQRRLEEVEEAHDVAKAIVDSLALEYRISGHCSGHGWISRVVPQRRRQGSDGDEGGNGVE